MSIGSYLVIDLVKTGLNRIHPRPRPTSSLVVSVVMLDRLHAFFFPSFFARVLSCLSLRLHLCLSSLSSHRPLRFLRLRVAYTRASRSTRARCAQDARKWRGRRHSGEFKKRAGFARPAILTKSATCPSVQLVNHSRSNGLTWLEMTYPSNNTVKDCQKGKRRANDAQRPCEKH